MFVSDLALNDFRSYRELVVQVPAGVVVFQGRNGRGKTNLVEALGYLSTLSSHRVNADKALVRAGEPKASAAVVRVRLEDGVRTSVLELEIVAGKANRARLNRGPVAPRELLGMLRTVTFAPEDLQLLRGDPGGRRRLLDDIITQIKPHYVEVRSDFERVLRQRSAVLKQGGGPDLAVWNEAAAKLSAQIAAHRLTLVKSLAASVATNYLTVSDNDKQASISYDLRLLHQEQKYGIEAEAFHVPQIEDGYFPEVSALAQQLAPRYLVMMDHYAGAEMRRGINLVGSHVDDLSISLNELPAKGYASHGETWSLVLAVRLAQMEVLTTQDSAPVLILDDVFAELDQGRRLALSERIKSVQQVFITCAVADDVPASLPVTRFHVTWDREEGSAVSALE